MKDTLLFNQDKYAKETYKAMNALFDAPTAGLIQTVDTITDIITDVVEAKYYQLAGQTPSDFVDIVVGRGAYASNVFQYTTAYVGASFEECLVNPASTGVHNNATADIAVDGITIKNNFYRQKYSVSQEEVKMAAANRVAFDVIEQKEKARAMTWQLGIQNTLFNGVAGNGFGLLNQPDVTINATLLPGAIETLTVAQIKAFAGQAMSTYFANANGTYMPNRWLMPTASYMALGVPYGDQFGMPTLREVFENAFKQAGAPADFKIVHAIYANEASTNGHGRHVLYNSDVDNICMYVPKQYTPHPLYPVGSLDMISDAEGQFTGVQVKKPGTVLYIDEQA